MPSECGLTSALMTGIGDVRIRQRMEACQQGIVHLDSLRQKHTRLMEQLRSQYPEFVTPATRSSAEVTQNNASTTTDSTSSKPTVYDSTTLPQTSTAPYTSSTSTSLPSAMNAAFATRCESPISACVSHRSSMSIDSGYTSISSDPFLSISATPMSYSAFRKKAATLERPPHASSNADTQSTSMVIATPNEEVEAREAESSNDKILSATIESTTGTAPMRQSRWGRKRDDASWQRPRSMYAAMSSSTALEDREYKDNHEDIRDKESLAGVCVAATARKLLDTSTFSQITPPPMSRKFATLQKTPPKPLPRSIYPPSSSSVAPLPPARTISASSSTLHEPNTSITSSTARTVLVNRPPPQFAKYDIAVQRQNAQVFAPIQTPAPKLAPSATSAFTPKNPLKPGSTPPTKPRGTSCSSAQPSRAFIVPILASAKEIMPPRHHRVGIATNEPSSVHLAQPASVLSRQQSYETNSITANSPLEIRKMFISTPHTISRYGASTNNNNGQNVNRCAFDKPPSCSSSAQSTPRSRREKIWHESEGL